MIFFFFRAPSLPLSRLTLCTVMTLCTSGRQQVNVWGAACVAVDVWLVLFMTSGWRDPRLHPDLNLSLFLLQSTEQVAAFCRSLHDMNPLECVSSSPSPDSPFPPPATPRQLSDADKLRKVICELVETERTYVKVSIIHLTCGKQMVCCECVRPPPAPVHRSAFTALLGAALALRITYSAWPIHIYLGVPGDMRGDTAVPLPGYCLIFFCLV